MEKDDGRKSGKAEMMSAKELSAMSAEELEALADEIEDEAREAGDLEERLALAFQADDLRVLAYRRKMEAGRE